MFEDISQAIKAAAVAELNAQAQALADLARSKAPRRKDPRKNRPGGELQKSIQAIEAVQDGESHWTAQVVATAPHAKFVEFPTVKSTAQPFLRPAVEESRDQVITAVTTAIHDAARGAKAQRVRRKLTIKLKGEGS